MCCSSGSHTASKKYFVSHKRFVTPEELDSFMAYLKDKRARLLRRTGEPLTSELKDLFWWFRTDHPIHTCPTK